MSVREIVVHATDTTDVRVSLSHYRGADRIDVRTFVDINNERRQTKKGVSIPSEKLPDLIAALQALAVHHE